MPEISLMPSIGISATGLDAETRRMEVIADNVANSQTTRDAAGKVFRRKQVVFAARLEQSLNRRGMGQGVEVKRIAEDMRPLNRVYRPGHPDADSEGFVQMPNISPVEEMVDMMSATRAYEANLAAMRAAKAMATQALEILE